MLDLSILLPTARDPRTLLCAILHLNQVIHRPYELVVIDRGGDACTGDVLMLAFSVLGRRLRVVHVPEHEPLGASLNRGVAIARGGCVAWLSPASRAIDGTLDFAADQLSAYEPVIVALPSEADGETALQDRGVRLNHLRGTLYADFGLIATRELRQLGGFDETLEAETIIDLSLRAWNAGLCVVPATQGAVRLDHAAPTIWPAQMRLSVLLARWDLPASASFDIRTPCTVIGPGRQAA